MTIDVQPECQQEGHSPGVGPRQVTAIVVIIALHFAILGLGLTAALATSSATGPRPAPREPMLVLSISMLQAWCSLGAIWWARSRWPAHVKTLATIIVCVTTWALMMGVLAETAVKSAASAGWASSLLVQALCLAIGTQLIDRLRPGATEVTAKRFSIMYLLIWTTVVAVVLGCARMLAIALGWTPDVFRWEYFLQLQTIGCFNALLALSLWTTLRAGRTWRSRIWSWLLIAPTMMLVVNVLLWAIFSNVGADVTDICWLYGGQTLFLLATLVPLQVAHKPAAPARGDAGHGPNVVPKTPPPPDSGR